MAFTNPIWIGIQGGTCAGKSTLAEALSRKLGPENTLLISLDRFYLSFDRKQYEKSAIELNVDHPDAIDWKLAQEVAEQLNRGIPTVVPNYDYVTGYRVAGSLTDSKKYIILEGLWPLYNSWFFELFFLRIYVDTPADVRLVRRLTRDILQNNRGWELSKILDYYVNSIKPMHEKFVEIGKERSDVIFFGDKEASQQVEIILSRLQLNS